jgi:hypothetical protein
LQATLAKAAIRRARFLLQETDCEDAFADRQSSARQRVITERVRPTRDIMDDTPAW